MPRRDYDGLSGRECLEALLLQLRALLEREGRLSESQVYHNVSITLSVGLDSYPHEPKIEVFTAKASVGEVPKGAKATKKQFESTKDYPIPDLVRDAIEEAKKQQEVEEDVSLLTQAEGRG